jgi:hypothetical protein
MNRFGIPAETEQRIRGNKSLRDWFQTPYCAQRDMPINSDTVAEPVRNYLRSAR